MKDAKAVTIFLFWTVGEGWLSRLIQRVSNPTHAGLGWVKDDGTKEYAEALFNKGFRAGMPFKKLLAWVNGHPKRKLIVMNTNIVNGDAEEVRQAALKLQGATSYSEYQLFQMWAFERLGLPVRRSSDKVVCSEVQAVLVQKYYNFTTTDRPTVDYLRPQDIYEQYKSLTINVTEYIYYKDRSGDLVAEYCHGRYRVLEEAYR